MALYNNLTLTNAGAALVNAWVTGTAHDPVPITAVGIGDGMPAPEKPKEVTVLVHEVKRLPAETAVLERGSLTVTAHLATDSITEDITHRELGIYSNDTLLAYGHAGTAYDTIPAAGKNTAVIKQITVHLTVGTIEVKLEPLDTSDYVTYKDFEARIGELAPPIIEEKAIEWFDSSEWLQNVKDAATETIAPVKEALETHIKDTVPHLQEGERDKWNKVITDLGSHAANTEVHIQSGERTKWDNAARDSQQALQDAAHAQNSADAAAESLTHHAEDTTLHVQPDEREKWDKTPEDLLAHTSNTDIHVTTDNKAQWDAAYAHTSDTASHVSEDDRAKWDKTPEDLNTHITNADVHVTPEDKAGWTQTGADLSAHTGNTEIHITADERTKWDKTGEDLATHTSNTDLHLQGEERAHWDAAYAHISDSDAHVSEDDRVKWDKTGEDLATHTGNTDLHLQDEEREHWDAAYAHISDSDAHLHEGDRAAWTQAVNDLSAHTGNADIHVTAEDKAAWTQTGADLETHTSNTDVHVTSDERTAWNGAIDTAAAANANAEAAKQAAASTAAELESHKTDTSAHLQADERERWDKAAETADAAALAARTAGETASAAQSSISSHIQDTSLHVGTINNEDGSVSYMANEASGGILKYTGADGAMSKITLYDGSDEHNIRAQIVSHSPDKATIARLNVTTSGMYYSTGTDISVAPEAELAVKGDVSTAKNELLAAIKAQVESVLHYKGTVATVDALPAADNTVGDVYNVTDTGANYAWDGTAWDKLSETLDLAIYATKEALSIHTSDSSIHVSPETRETLSWLDSNKSTLADLVANPPQPGEKGCTGERGEKGCTGERGEKGCTGEKGEKGCKGDPGSGGGGSSLTGYTTRDCTALGCLAKTSGYKSTALGVNALANTCMATAVGYMAYACGTDSTALGRSAKASGTDSTALGSSAKASGTDSTALGSSASASGTDSTALGSSAKACKDYSTALGDSATASGSNSTALGYSAKACGDKTTSIGYRTYALGQYSLALGNEAKAACSTAAISVGAVGSTSAGTAPALSVYFIAPGSVLSTKYLSGCAGIGYLASKTSGVKKLSEVFGTATFNPFSS